MGDFIHWDDSDLDLDLLLGDYTDYDIEQPSDECFDGDNYTDSPVYDEASSTTGPKQAKDHEKENKKARYACPLCRKTYMSIGGFRGHVTKKHNRSDIKEVLSEAVKILKGEYCVRALEEHKMDKALIFCRTKIDCDNMECYFNQRGGGKYSCVCLHGDRKPPERKANLQKFKDGKVRFLICTDVAARGIDVSGLPYVINVTLPDEKQNYIHRIGRVGRAERMGLAVSLVSTVKEKVWYHSNCHNRGRGCYNTRLTDEGGCCIWYNEPQLKSDVEEHLDITIDLVEPNFKVPVNEFDGKVMYGQKKKASGSAYQGHVQFLAPTVAELAQLEKRAQSSFIDMKFKKKFATR